MAYFGYFGKSLSQLVGYVYPFYASVVSIEANATGIWLTYWVVYSLFGIFEGLIDGIFFWFNYYYTLKIIFLLYLFLPQTLGAQFLYEKAILPAFKAIEEPIDEIFGAK